MVYILHSATKYSYTTTVHVDKNYLNTYFTNVTMQNIEHNEKGHFSANLNPLSSHLSCWN